MPYPLSTGPHTHHIHSAQDSTHNHTHSAQNSTHTPHPLSTRLHPHTTPTQHRTTHTLHPLSTGSVPATLMCLQTPANRHRPQMQSYIKTHHNIYTCDFRTLNQHVDPVSNERTPSNRQQRFRNSYQIRVLSTTRCKVTS